MVNKPLDQELVKISGTKAKVNVACLSLSCSLTSLKVHLFRLLTSAGKMLLATRVYKTFDGLVSYLVVLNYSFKHACLASVPVGGPIDVLELNEVDEISDPIEGHIQVSIQSVGISFPDVLQCAANTK